MKYKICFTREIKPDFISRMIMKFLRSNYSHVMLGYEDIIYHATGKGVHSQTRKEFLAQGKEVVYSFLIDLPLSPSELKSYMRGAEGKEYSNSQYLGFLFPALQRYVANGKSKQICSELVCDVLAEFGNYEFPKMHDFMSPRDVYEFLSAEYCEGNTSLDLIVEGEIV